MDNNALRELVSIKEACAYLHVSRRTIYNWIKAGKLETERTAGGSTRIYKDSLLRTHGAPLPPSRFSPP